MNWLHQPAPWSNFFTECGYYVMLGGVVHVLAFIVLFLPITCLMFGRIKVSTILLFQVTLYVVAMLANGLWSCLIWGRFYWSADYVSDFSPFYPIFRSVIDFEFGDQVGVLNNISLLTLNGIWMLFACASWITALLITRFMTKKRNPSNARIVAEQVAESDH